MPNCSLSRHGDAEPVDTASAAWDLRSRPGPPPVTMPAASSSLYTLLILRQIRQSQC